MKAVHFGAGSIGRGFIADLLHDSGYEIVFIDVDKRLVDQINKDHDYHLYVIEEGYRKKTIDNVRALSPIEDPELVNEEIATADIITTAVWADNLSKIAPTLSKGLQMRLLGGSPRINVLACENAMFNSEILKKEILKLKEISAKDLDNVAAFPNTAVDRMVLEDTRAGERVINIGTDYELVIEKNKLVEEDTEPIIGATYTDQLEKYIERKLYIINCGHAWAGYIGHVYGYAVMSDIFANEKLVDMTKSAMKESADLLSQKYGFTLEDLDSYIEFAVRRFQTPGVVDTVKRVCRSPIRKLEPSERLVGPTVQCEERSIENKFLIEGIAAVFLYEDQADDQANELSKFVLEHGIALAIEKYTGLTPDSRIHKQIIEAYEHLNSI